MIRRGHHDEFVLADGGTRREAVPEWQALDGAASAVEDAPPARSRVRVFRLVPWFLVGFVITAGVNSFGVIPAGVHSALSAVSVFLITIALSAIGLSTDLAAFRRAGPRPLLLGLCL